MKKAALVGLFVACAFAFASFANSPPLTPMESFYGSPAGSAGGGGGGGGTVTGSGASPQVTFWTAASTIAGDAGLVYDSATNQLEIADGSAAAPSYSFLSAGNTDNGMYLVAANTLGWSTAGVERARASTTEYVVNDAANDYDFRWESTTNANGVIFDASTNRVGIGAVPVTYDIELHRSAASPVMAVISDGLTTGASVYRATNDGALTLDFQMRNSAGGSGIILANEALLIASTGMIFQVWDNPTPHYRFYTTTTSVPTTGGLHFSIEETEVVINNDSSAIVSIDSRFESDTKADSFFLDASAETTRLNGGAANGGCDISAAGALTCAGAISGSGTVTGSGANTQVTFWTAASTIAGDAGMTYDSATDSITLVGVVEAQGGDAAATPNFVVEAGEGIYDSGVNSIAVAAGGVNAMTWLSNGQSVFTNGTTSAPGIAASSLDAGLSFDTAGSGTITLSNTTGPTIVMSADDTVSLLSGSGDNIVIDPGGAGVAQVNSVITQPFTAKACAAGVLALDPTGAEANIALDANGAACVVTLAKTAAVLGSLIKITVVTSAGAGTVTFPSVAGTHSGPTLCTTTGIAIHGVYVISFTDEATDQYEGVSCNQNT